MVDVPTTVWYVYKVSDEHASSDTAYVNTCSNLPPESLEV